MENVNDCSSCEHKKNPQGGWCYMFKEEEPRTVCMQHTGGDGHIYAATSMINAKPELNELMAEAAFLAVLLRHNDP